MKQERYTSCGNGVSWWPLQKGWKMAKWCVNTSNSNNSVLGSQMTLLVSKRSSKRNSNAYTLPRRLPSTDARRVPSPSNSIALPYKELLGWLKLTSCHSLVACFQRDFRPSSSPYDPINWSPGLSRPICCRQDRVHCWEGCHDVSNIYSQLIPRCLMGSEVVGPLGLDDWA